MAASRSSYVCVYCDRDVSRSFFVHCAECSSNSSTGRSSRVHLCGDCFLSGGDVPEANHCSEHSYIVATCLEIPLFSKDWTVSEELALLDGKVMLTGSYCVVVIIDHKQWHATLTTGIERCGIGNWKVISDDLIPSETAAASYTPMPCLSHVALSDGWMDGLWMRSSLLSVRQDR